MIQTKSNKTIYFFVTVLLLMIIFMLSNRYKIESFDNTIETRLLIKIDSLTSTNLILFDSILSLKHTDTVIEHKITNTIKTYEKQFIYFNTTAIDVVSLDSFFTNWQPK